MNYETQKLRVIKEGLIFLAGVIIGMMIAFTLAACIINYQDRINHPVEDTTLYQHSEIPESLDVNKWFER